MRFSFTKHFIYEMAKTSVSLSHLLCCQVKDLETHLQRLKSDLHNCVGFIQEPMKLRDSVQMIYSRYVPQANGVSGACGVADAESSLHQQPLAVTVLYEV